MVCCLPYAAFVALLSREDIERVKMAKKDDLLVKAGYQFTLPPGVWVKQGGIAASDATYDLKILEWPQHATDFWKRGGDV